MKEVVVLGDSFNNTLGLIRTLGECGAKPILVFVGDDRLWVSKSRYLADCRKAATLADAMTILLTIGDTASKPMLIATNDPAAEFIDNNETTLSTLFTTPMRGGRLGKWFEKDFQCQKAAEAGLDVPKTVLYRRGEPLPETLIYPVISKPAESTNGAKSDIHICHDSNDLQSALNDTPSRCSLFLIQQFVKKEYEINMLGIATEHGVYIPGAVRKIRHYPHEFSPCSFGKYMPVASFGINVEAVKRLVERSGYKGPFSVEMLHSEGKNYFMEVNFRNDGLAYVATAAGANLLKPLLTGEPAVYKVRPTYMMDLSTDYCHVKDGKLSKSAWVRDLCKHGCMLNWNWLDPMPTLTYYTKKLLR